MVIREGCDRMRFCALLFQLRFLSGIEENSYKIPEIKGQCSNEYEACRI
jgi:hypothetical protein